MKTSEQQDQELELAAKAAGHEFKWDRPRGAKGGWLRIKDGDRWPVWNPRVEDGEAFRLASAVGLTVEFGNNLVLHPHEVMGRGTDPLAATRSAIVCAAAEIERARAAAIGEKQA